MNKTLRIGMGCGLGGFFGIAIANVWFAPYSILGLLLGAVVGGLLSAFVYVLEDIIHYVPIAWRQVAGWRPKPVDWEMVGLKFRLFGVSIAATLSIIFVTAFFSFLTSDDIAVVKSKITLYEFLLVSLGVAGSSALILSIVIPGTILGRDKKEAIRDLLSQLEIVISLKWNVLCAPFTVMFYLIKWFLEGVRWLDQNKHLLLPFTIRLFILVGSEGIRCCFVDTAIAVAIGWMLNLTSPIGLLFGGLIGVGIGIFHHKVVESMPSHFKKTFG